MEGSIVLTWIVGFLILLFVALLSSVLFKKINFPYTIGLVIAGIVIEYIFRNYPGLGPVPFSISHDVILYVLLPVLIFESAINMNTDLLLKNLKPILFLAAPGLIVSTLIVGYIMGRFTPIGMGGAMLFGALISATDPVAVITMFKTLGAPKRLVILVDGESLFNDATAIVAYQTVLSIVVSGAALTLPVLGQKAVSFVVVFVGGFLAGGVIAYIFMHISKLFKGQLLLQSAISIIIAYTSFITADRLLGLSGVMAALGAGIVTSWFARPRLPKETKLFLSDFWSFIAFVANSFIFLIVGIYGKTLMSQVKSHLNLILYILLAIVAILVSRAFLVYVLTPLFFNRDEKNKIDRPYQHLIFWAGLRGAVALALSFSLPENLPYRYAIILITIGVVLYTLFVQGTTMKKAMIWQGLAEEGEGESEGSEGTEPPENGEKSEEPLPQAQ